MPRFVPTKEAFQLFHEGMQAFSEMEANGIRIDMDYLTKTIASTEAEIVRLQNELKKDEVWRLWKKIFGVKAKLGSRPQLGKIIFDHLKYERKVSAHTESGETENQDEAAFSQIDLPFLKDYFKIAKLEKTLSTYLTGILREVVDGRVHPSFLLNIARTFRSSCKEPNFQNIPTRNPLMAELIRKCYIATDDNYQIGEIDLSGAEVRVAACYNEDPVLIKYIKDPKTDMHRDTACKLFFLKPDQVDKKGPRDASKNMFVFPQFYGSVYFQCAPDIWEAMISRKFKIKDTDILVIDHLRKHGIKELGDVSPKAVARPGTFVHQCKVVEEELWKSRFRVYAQWKRDWFAQYQKDGGFITLTGFAVNGMLKRNDAVNYPIQGSAFHCLLWCLIRIMKWLRKYKMKTKIVGQIHDSIVADIYRPEMQDFLAKCKEVFTVDLPRAWRWINVPIEIEAEVAGVGESWFAKQGVLLP